MNKATIIGNLTKDPELRTTTSGESVCNFTVAVNRRKRRDGMQEADYFRVSVWRTLGESCSKYLAKGRKVCVVGSVSARAYADREGKPAASLEILAEDVEFLSSSQQGGGSSQSAPQDSPGVTDQQTGYQQVDFGDDELPF